MTDFNNNTKMLSPERQQRRGDTPTVGTEQQEEDFGSLALNEDCSGGAGPTALYDNVQVWKNWEKI